MFDRPIPVKKGNWIALTVPTWVPPLATNLGSGNWWRSSRPQGQLRAAASLRQSALEELREVSRFGCTYSGARLLYTATYVPSNRLTNEKPTTAEPQPARQGLSQPPRSAVASTR